MWERRFVWEDYLNTKPMKTISDCSLVLINFNDLSTNNLLSIYFYSKREIG